MNKQRQTGYIKSIIQIVVLSLGYATFNLVCFLLLNSLANNDLRWSIILGLVSGSFYSSISFIKLKSNLFHKTTAILVLVGFQCIQVLYGFSLVWLLAEVLLVRIIPAIIIASLINYYVFIAFCVYGFSEATNTGESTHRFEKWLYVVSASLAPLFPLFHYYINNITLFTLADMVLFGIAFSFFSVAYFFVFERVVGARSSTIPIAIWWTIFWVYPYIIKYYAPIWVMLMVAIVLGGTVYLLSRYPLDSLVGTTFGAVIICLALYNIGNGAYHNIQRNTQLNQYCIKQEFQDGISTDSPDIYWFHMDGMMNFDVMESILYTDQIDFFNQLQEKGFEINKNAKLDIGWTYCSIPAMTCPDMYDNYISKLIEKMSGSTDMERRRRIEPLISFEDVFPKLELFAAFRQKGYENYYIVSEIGRGLETIPVDCRYENAFGLDLKSNCVRLLSEHTLLAVISEPLSNIESRLRKKDVSPFSNEQYDERIFDYVNPQSDYLCLGVIEHYDWKLSNIFERLLYKQSPKLVYIQNLIAHCPFRYDENGVYHPSNSDYAMTMYSPQFDYAAKVMLGMIDRIIEENPDAVIIIQADHGVHGFQRLELATQGFTDDQMLEMNYSTISAVRIPEKYGTLAEPLDPLDITRYLVNRYVGEGNYDYLYYSEEE